MIYIVCKLVEFILLAVIYGASSERSLIESYHAGVMSTEPLVFFWFYIVAFTLFCLGCSESSYSTRIVICKVFMFSSDIMAFLFTLFLNLDIGESLFDTSNGFTIIVGITFILDIFDILFDIVLFY